jgi:hypothetical protein
MITIRDFRLQENKEGKEFITLVLQGDVEFVQSLQTGRFYATAKRCTISSTFDLVTAEALIGTKLPGHIERMPCPEYNFTVPETGEVIKLAHTYQYVPDDIQEEESLPRVVVPATVQS